MASQEKKTSEGNPAPASSSSSSSSPPFLEGSSFDSLDAYLMHTLQSAAKATAASQALPGAKAQDWDYYNTFSGFRKVMKTEKATAQDMITKILDWNGIKNHRGRITGVPEFLDLLSEANDQILERISTNLDEAAGIKRRGDPELLSVSVSPAVAQVSLSGSWNRRQSSSGAEVKLLTAKNITRPQMGFKDLVDNADKPFIPRLKEKPNSKKPLSILPEYAEDGVEYYSHPYLYELNLLHHTEQQLDKEEPGRMVPLEDADFTYVDDEAALLDMVSVLKRESVIGVDTEHHSYRTFLGITSLIQISTITRDYVVDPYPIWKEMTALNEVFTDPKIVKILHGADSEIGWLQRDFSVYLVNVFDTHLAAKALNFPAGCRSFAYLLKNFCNVTTDKKYQLADWRIRPLPEEMMRYARLDTRYHIYIYRVMKNALIDAGNETKNLLRSTLDLGTDLCKHRYERPRLTPFSHLDLMKKCRMTFNSRQVHALKEIFAWRDKTAREEDESESFVLPVHMMLKICTELPREMQGILACCNPIPPLVKQSLGELHVIIVKAREQPLSLLRDDIEDTARKNMDQLEALHSNVVEDPLKCPLDLGGAKERSGEQTVLLDADGIIQMTEEEESASRIDLKKKPALSVFTTSIIPSQLPKLEKSDNSFLSPYQRYQMLKPYLKFLASKEENKSEQSTDSERINSIKEHFDSLTALTAEEFTASKKEEEEEEEDVKEEPEDVEMDDADRDKYANAGQVSSLRVKKDKNKKKPSLKRPSGEVHVMDVNNIPAKSQKMQNSEKASSEINYEDSDWGQFSQKKGAGPKGQFNPWDGYDKKHKKGGLGRL